MRCIKNCNACSRHWSKERTQCFSTTASHLPDRMPADYHFFKHLDNFFCRENTSTTSRRKKMLSKSLSNPEPQILHYRSKQTYSSLAKMCLIVMVPILINQWVFESSDNDLKSMVQNHNYVCTDLILTYFVPHRSPIA